MILNAVNHHTENEPSINSVLIVEDEFDSYLYLSVLLKSRVKRIDHAWNGKEALEMADKKGYDLILMDLKMPVMSGIEATKLFKSRYPAVPVIITTAYATYLEKEKAVSAGCDDYLTKPIRRADLHEAITRILRNHGLKVAV